MMLKKLIPAAVLLALAGAAQAQVSIYGLVDAGIVKTPDEKASLQFGGNSSTRVGLKGSTDVGSGVKANFQLESSAISIDGKLGAGDDVLFGRQAWAGFSGRLGEVRLGRQDTVGNQTMIGFDLNGAANTASASAAVKIIDSLFNGQGTRSVQYIAPVVGGFKLQLGYQSPVDVEPITSPNPKASSSVGLTYTADKLSLALATSSKTETDGKRASSYAASYDFGVFKAVANFSGTKGAQGSMVGVVAPVGGVNLGLQIASNTDTKARATELFVNKEVFKNTFAYADFVQGKGETGAKFDAYAIGMIYTF